MDILWPGNPYRVQRAPRCVNTLQVASAHLGCARLRRASSVLSGSQLFKTHRAPATTCAVLLMRARGRFIARAGRSPVRALSRALRVRAAVQGGAQCSPLPRTFSLLREAPRSVSTDEPCPGALAEQNAPMFSRLRSVVASLRSAANCSPLSRTSARQTSSPQRLSRCGGHRSFPAAAPRGSVLVVRQRSAQLSPTSGASV